MLVRKVVIIFFLLLIELGLFAQTPDTTRHVDTLFHKDSLISNVISEVNDTVKKNDTPPNTNYKPQAGYIITGKILDANTAEGIPFATIFFPHTPSGTATDLDGNFSIHISNLPNDTLKFQALGYEAVIKKLIKARNEYTYKIEMHRSLTTLTEFTIHAKGVDPALLLVKRIIQHKPQNNPDRTDNYKYESYNRLELDMRNVTGKNAKSTPILNKYKFVFNNLDTTSETEHSLPVYLTETISDYYFRRHPKKEREIIKGSMIKGVNNKDITQYLGTAYQNINVYNNGIPVLDKKFISPISNEGPLFYKYAIKDTQRAFGHNIILVQFKPRRDGDLCFNGDFWVVDTVYAIERVTMEVPRTVNLNWADRVSLYQEFAPVDSVWFCTKDKFVAGVSAYNSKKIPGLIARKTTTYHHILINNPSIDDSLDKPEWKERVIHTDSSAAKTDDWWINNRPDTLTNTEKSIHKMVDTILSMPITKHYINVVTFLSSGVKDFGPIELGPYWFIYSNNPYEGDRLRFSFGTPRTLKDLHLAAYVAYGFKDNEYKYGLEEKWVIQRKPWTYLYSIFTKDLSNGIDNFDHVRSDNIFSNLVRKHGIPWKQAFMEDQRIEFYKLYFNGLSHTILLQHRVYTPFAPLPSTDIFLDKKGSKANNVTNSQAGLEFRYAYKEKYLDSKYNRVYVGTKYPVIDIVVTGGFKDVLNSAYSYQKVNFSIKESINIPSIGQITYNLYGGKYFGNLPYPLLEVHPGNEYLYYDPHAFEMMNTYEFISDQFAAINIEHDLGGGIFNRIPLFKKLKLRQFWTAKGIVGSLNKENIELNLEKGYPFRTLQGNPYLEIGTGVANIFRMLRFDFVWRVMPKPVGTESKDKYFGVFGSIHFEF